MLTSVNIPRNCVVEAGVVNDRAERFKMRADTHTSPGLPS